MIKIKIYIWHGGIIILRGVPAGDCTSNCAGGVGVAVMARMVVLLLSIGLVACSAAPRIPGVVSKSPLVVQHPDQVEVKYLGGGGVLLRRGQDMVMTSPFVSNFSTWELLIPRDSKYERVDQALTDDISRMEAILLSGTHYYQAMDVPYIATAHAPAAKIYGGSTAVHLLAPAIDRQRLMAITKAASGSKAGEWLYSQNKRMRFMAIDTDLISPVSMLSSARLDEDQIRLPRLPRSYPAGENYAWLIDFLNSNGTVSFRAFYQDAPSNFGMGQLPVLKDSEQAPVDVALLGVSRFYKADRYPAHILSSVRPRNVVAIRWEDIRRPNTGVLREDRAGDLEAFQNQIRQVSQAPVKTPAPGTTIHFRVKLSDPIQTATK
ncbi:hypothetical protein HNQ59_001167 [Chitinivorax tropicus]|uniref:Uncharacterized protein n=1 Tax=Chitinivorax tropicus TaxID=714531 RepID=A0A840MLW3_9PROT|nr:hypothetical protein [Chitinivorax tropicus]MBB5017897.1 hypothetical protein [Chitinivorax tropicus]